MIDPYLTKDGTELPVASASDYRISVTTIESIYNHLTAEYETKEQSEKAAQSILDGLKGIFVPNYYMTFGTKCHKILEKGKDGFTPKELFIYEPLLKYRELGVTEYKLTKDYEIFDKLITVVGKADVYRPNIVIDYKMSFYGKDLYERYSSSYQWKFYLDIFDCSNFLYKVFLFDNYEQLTKVENIRFEAYPEMKGECIRVLEIVYNYLKYNDLLKYVEVKMK